MGFWSIGCTVAVIFGGKNYATIFPTELQSPSVFCNDDSLIGRRFVDEPIFF